MTAATLDQFDFLNVTSLSAPAQTVTEFEYYTTTKSIAANKIVLPMRLFGANSNQTVIASLGSILAADPDAWQQDQVSGGTLANRATL